MPKNWTQTVKKSYNPMMDEKFFSEVCTLDCGGICCDPWWGIISYPVVKQGGLSDLSGFRKEVLAGLLSREKRIVDAYVTNEAPTRALFRSPEKYNIKIGSLKVNGSTLSIELVAMFAFRCAFLSEKNACAIHPSVLGGDDIRPPHCGFLGAPDAKPGEKGHCRVIHAASLNKGGKTDIKKAVELERSIGAKSLEGGSDTAEEATDRFIEELKQLCEAKAPQLFPQKKSAAPGRNDPCWCGSGQKFKKCHG